MNRVFQSSTSQQMMGANPGWWNSMRPPPQQVPPFLASSSSSTSSTSAVFSHYPQQTGWHEEQDLPESWSQMLLGGMVGEECNYSTFLAKKTDSLEDQALYSSMGVYLAGVKHELSENGYPYGYANEEISTMKSTWSQVLQVSSPISCVTSLSSNLLDFSSSPVEGRRPQMDHPECNSASNGAAFKKARIQPSSSANSSFKVRKEKLGDRITALHQLVSPFGKTDTASVLAEAIGYIRFLQSQIEALCSPYLGNGSANMGQPQLAQEEGCCIFPEDPGQLLNDASTKKRAAAAAATEYEADGGARDLKSRGLCLVPVSSTLHVGNDNGADYWAPSLGAGFR